MTNPDLSIIDLVQQADIVVKAVMFSLVLASVVSWAIIFAKFMQIKRLHNAMDFFEMEFWASNSLDQYFAQIRNNPLSITAKTFVAAMSEWFELKKQGRTILDAGERIALKERMYKMMDVAKNREIYKVESQVGFLATVGSVSPFVGLFGTVWGIMNSFTAIAGMNNASLAVVAPGIAEALFATALGLVAAIPAVMAFNKLNSEIGKIENRANDFGEEFIVLISRQLDAM
jgi:biopolymer transport protein TolQ